MLSIALCTYNGEKYIYEQLHSIALQTLLPDEVIICDDCSTDSTVEIIKRFQQQAPFTIKFTVNSRQKGTVANFSAAIMKCTGEYIAISDQDDIWCPQKLEKSVRQIRRAEKKYTVAMPLLVHTDLCVVDAAGAIKAASMMDTQKLHNEQDMQRALGTLLVQNYITGCTIVINKKLQQIACPFPPAVIMHDWWLALIAATMGQIVFIREPLIFYRQHNDNQIGAKTYYSLGNIKKCWDTKQRYRQIEKTIIQAKELQHTVEAITEKDNKNKAVIQKYISLLKNKKIKQIYALKIRKQGFARNMITYGYLFYYRKKIARLLIDK